MTIDICLACHPMMVNRAAVGLCSLHSNARRMRNFIVDWCAYEAAHLPSRDHLEALFQEADAILKETA